MHICIKLPFCFVILSTGDSKANSNVVSCADTSITYSRRFRSSSIHSRAAFPKRRSISSRDCCDSTPESVSARQLLVATLLSRRTTSLQVELLHASSTFYTRWTCSSFWRSYGCFSYLLYLCNIHFLYNILILDCAHAIECVGIEWATLDTQTPPTLEPNLPPLSGDASASDPVPALGAGQSGAAGGSSASSKQLETGLSNAQFARLLALNLTDELGDGTRMRGESNASEASASASAAGQTAPAPVPDQYALRPALLMQYSQYM